MTDLHGESSGFQAGALAAFEARLRFWIAGVGATAVGQPDVSIEVPVVKGGWLMPCIDSVLQQTQAAWRLSLRWDTGDDWSAQILERVERVQHPRLRVYRGDRLGIARNRRFLTDHSEGEFILPLDDDDMLEPRAVERLLDVATRRPWSGIVRARRDFVDETGNAAGPDTWFAFEPRRFEHGMVCDVHNHSQPTLIRRSAYARTTGWEGFPDFQFAGEDCDILLKVEEVASIELLDEVLYHYRLHGGRASLELTNAAAFEMWRRLADRAIARTGLEIRRVTDCPPFRYERLPATPLSVAAVDFVIVPDAARPAGDGGAPVPEHTAAALRSSGVRTDQIHPIPGAVTGADWNAAIRRTARPVIGLLTGGVEPEAGALPRLLRCMQERNADAVAPKVIAPDGTIVWALPYLARSAEPAVRGRGKKDRRRYGAVVETDWLPPAALFVRRGAHAAVGGFDEDGTDPVLLAADLCLRLRRRALTCLYVGSATATMHAVPGVPPPVDASQRGRFEARWRPLPKGWRRIQAWCARARHAGTRSATGG